MHSAALFWDVENIGLSWIADVFEALEKTWHLRVKRVYGKNLNAHDLLLRTYGVDAIELPPNKAGKNCADICIALDAAEALARPEMHGLVLVSGDSDFRAVCWRARERGKEAIIFAPPHAPLPLREAATTFFPLKRIDPVLREARSVMRHHVRSFLANEELRHTVDVFAGFVRQRDPQFSLRHFNAQSFTKLLQKAGVCVLQPVLEASGKIGTYELRYSDGEVEGDEPPPQ